MIHLLNVVCEHRSKTQWQEMHINVSALFVLGTVLVLTVKHWFSFENTVIVYNIMGTNPIMKQNQIRVPTPNASITNLLSVPTRLWFQSLISQ